MKFGTKKVFTEVSYSDVEAMAKKAYGLDGEKYSFVAVQECGNDEEHSFKVDGKVDYYNNETAKLIREGKDVPLYTNHVLLNCLCADGFIKPGQYLVKVCW
jgi:hypothetical protein